MEPWQIGLVALCVVGLAAIVYGALVDRAANRRRARAMQSPPDRPIPQFAAHASAPTYLSDRQARRSPATSAGTPVASTTEARLGAPTLAAGYASADFVTDAATGQAILEHAAVLVCDDDVASVRELLGPLEAALQTGTPLVLLAPALARDVLATLEVNRIQGKLAILVVLAPDAADRAIVVQQTGATATIRGDRQAGYLPAEHLGHVDRWVATRTGSHLSTADPRG